MNIIITGANGFIGRNIIKEFKNYYKIFAISRFPVEDVSFFCRPSDLFSEKTLSKLKKFKPTHIIHTQGTAHKKLFENLTKKKYKEINENFTEKLFKLSIFLKVKKFIYTSSLAVHESEGFSNTLINENSALNGKSSYAMSKINSEEIIKKLSSESNTSFIILRPAVIYGKDAPGNILKLYNFVNLFRIFPSKGIKNSRSILSINNFISVIKECLINSKADNSTFLIADTETISTEKLITYISEGINKSVKVFNPRKIFLHIIYKLPIIGKVFKILTKNLVVDSTLIRKKLCWEQPFDQDEELKTLFKMQNK